MRRHVWLIPVAALLAVALLALGGPSCGKDNGFHLQSWFDAAQQLRHGTLYPRWTFAAAYNSGEPRFTFYPPISWLLGGWLLVFRLPFAAVPIAVAWIALTLAGFAMHRLARRYASPDAAMLAACLYLANPFMLFSIVARAAYGEIFAAAFCPLLIAAMLAEQPSAWAIAFPLAGMALSNVPGGILGGYLFLFLAVVRVAMAQRIHHRRMLTAFVAAPVAAFGVAAIYLLPALRQRSLIRMADGFPPGLRSTDNLLLHRTLLTGRDDFMLHIQHMAAVVGAVTLLALGVAWQGARRRSALPLRDNRIGLSPLAAITALTLAVLFSITFLAAPLWRTLPALWIVQFPWRALFILAACLAFAVALALRTIQLRPAILTVAALVLTAATAFPAIHHYREPCAAADTPPAVLAALQGQRNPEPTDEYVPVHAHLGAYRPDNPAFWLEPDPTAYAPHTTPNRVEADPTALMPAAPPNAQLAATPLHFTVNAVAPTALIVNLEDYPNWLVTRDGREHPAHIPRRDGLIAIAIPAGVSMIDIRWQPGWDERLGTAISLLTLLAWFMPKLVRRARWRTG
jgi:hypothetical protein